MGCFTDCEILKKEGDLQAAYPSEYLSFKKRKEYATTTPGWHWAKEWTKFRDFLRGMGPKPAPDYELDRKDPTNKAYGPGLCRWLDNTGQNNNKSDNVKICVPLTGEEFTVKKISAIHKMQPTTVYGWLDKGYTVLEILVGKRLPHLSAFIEELAKLPPVAPKGTKTPVKKIDASKVPKPDSATRWDEIDADLWHECNLDCGGDSTETKVLFGALMAQRAQEYAKLVDWVGRYNAGLPCDPQPPQGSFYKPKLLSISSTNPTSSKPPNVPPVVEDDAEDDSEVEDDEVTAHGFDPADCVDPADYGYFDEDDED